MDETLSGNSYKSRIEKKEDKKVIEKVVSGEVIRKKGNRLSSFIISEDADKVKSYILLDVLIPSFKKAIYDIITSGIEMILYGESGKNRNNTNASKVSYARYYDSPSNRERYLDSYRRGYSYDEIIIENRGDAEEVLDKMYELISVYGMASVADFYDLVGINGNFTDNKYGWKDLRSAKVVRLRDGYCIRFPKAEPLN